MSAGFIAHAQAHGLLMREAIADGRWHRVPTEDKPRKRNGAYLLDQRGGVVRNWATMETFARWRPDGEPSRVSAVDWRAMAARQHAEKARRQQRAAATAQDMIKAATLVRPHPTVRVRGGWSEAVEAHPYLARKGFAQQPGLVLDGALLVPMYDLQGRLVGAQRIAEDGAKLFLPGTRAQGAVHRLGRGRERWLVEGYATGLSVLAACERLYRGAEVVVCFFAGNLGHVASIIGPCYIVADNDASGTGQRVAETTGKPWCMPQNAGQDANDLHLTQGLDALMALLRTVIMR